MAPIDDMAAGGEPAAKRAARGGAALRQERGYALRSGAGYVAAAHLGPIELDPEQSGDAALRQIGLACLDSIARNEGAVLAGVEDGIHQMRVAVRRLRATLSAFRKLLPDHQRRWASEELRWLADALGPARNFDVFEATLLKSVPQDVGSPPALEKLRRAAHRQRRAAYRDAAKAVRSPRYPALVLHLSRWFETCGWRTDAAANGLKEPIGDIAESALQRRWRAAKKRSKGFAAQSAGQRHRLRIALKKLRYTAESLAALYPRRKPESFIRRVKRLQDDLGHANDVRMGHDIVAALAPAADSDAALAEAGERLLGWHEKRLVKSEPKMRKHLHKLFENEPFWRR